MDSLLLYIRFVEKYVKGEDTRVGLGYRHTHVFLSAPFAMFFVDMFSADTYTP